MPKMNFVNWIVIIHIHFKQKQIVENNLHDIEKITANVEAI
jgi:hypothetical protein